MLPDASLAYVEQVAGGRFSLDGILGRGANGVVVRVHDRQLGHPLALKTLDRLDPGSLLRLKEEFRGLAGIVHPNLALLHELFVLEEGCFFTMELVEGRPFVEALATAAPDACVRATAQLVSALDHLHRSGKLHCDVKPSNVLVESSGRVVVLDFGLTIPLGAGAGDGLGYIRCSPAYAAPEQLWGGPLGAAADWYAVGGMLFELLAGRLPFVGHPAELVFAKQTYPAPSLLSVAPGSPAPLAELVDGLLQADPAARIDPGRWLLDQDASLRAGVGIDAPGVARTFVGRSRQLEQLETALDIVLGDRMPALVDVAGPSGIGKSTLVRRFLGSIRAMPGVRILEGRCHPRESIPFNALDQVIDGLASRLAEFSPAELEEVLPEGAPELAILFPVLRPASGLLGRVSSPVGGDPIELRRRGAEALRELLGTLARRERLVVWIDDFQWADPDGLAILRQVMRGPGAPPLLLVVSFRSEDEGARARLDAIGAAGDGRQPELRRAHVQVEALATDEVAALARAITAAIDDPEGSGHPGGWDDPALLALADGSPFAIEQIVRVLARGGEFRPGAASRSVEIPALLLARVTGLSEDERALLDVVSVAGHPLAAEVALEASGIRSPALRVLGRLEAERLIRWVPGAGRARVDVDHDRIREGLVGTLAAEAVRAGHGRIALALESSVEADPQDLFVHHLRGGDPARALVHGRVVAERAKETLAFGRAVAVYRELLAVAPTASDDHLVLQQRLGEALELDGQSLGAAEQFDRLSRSLTERGRAPDDPWLRRLEQRAAENYLRTGHFDQGMRLTRRVLAGVGVRFPESQALAAAQLGWRRFRLWRRGIGFDARPPAAMDERTRSRLEAVWSTAMSFSVVDQVVADSLGVLHLREALDRGDPIHVGRALGWEATKAVQVGGARVLGYGKRALEEAGRLARETGDPHLQGWALACEGIWAYQRAHWRACVAACDESVRIFREVCPDAPGAVFNRITFTAFALSSLAHLGELGELSRRLPEAIADVDERGDLYAGIGLRAGILNLAWLAEDRAAAARQVIDDSIRRWPVTDGFQIQHYLELIGRVHLELYAGSPAAALSAVESAWPRVKKAGFLLLESPSVELRNLRARAMLGAAATLRATGRRELRVAGTGRDWDVVRLLAEVRREITALGRCTLASAAPFAELLHAGVARVEGREPEAVARATAAAEALGRIEMGLYRCGALWLRAELDGRGASAGREEATAVMAAQGIVRPERMARVFAPAVSGSVRGADGAVLAFED